MLILDPDPDVDYTDTEPPTLVAMTVDGRTVRYVPGMELDTPGVLELVFGDSNPVLPPDILLGGV